MVWIRKAWSKGIRNTHPFYNNSVLEIFRVKILGTSSEGSFNNQGVSEGKPSHLAPRDGRENQGGVDLNDWPHREITNRVRGHHRRGEKVSDTLLSKITLSSFASVEFQVGERRHSVSATPPL